MYMSKNICLLLGLFAGRTDVLDLPDRVARMKDTMASFALQVE